jgi:hypothetical protein
LVFGTFTLLSLAQACEGWNMGNIGIFCKVLFMTLKELKINSLRVLFFTLML